MSSQAYQIMWGVRIGLVTREDDRFYVHYPPRRFRSFRRAMRFAYREQCRFAQGGQFILLVEIIRGE